MALHDLASYNVVTDPDLRELRSHHLTSLHVARATGGLSAPEDARHGRNVGGQRRPQKPVDAHSLRPGACGLSTVRGSRPLNEHLTGPSRNRPQMTRRSPDGAPIRRPIGSTP